MAVVGAAGAIIIPLSFSILAVLFPDDAQRQRAVGVWAAGQFLTLPLGPLFGGWLLNNFHWTSIFWMNLPFAVLGMLAAVFFIPESRDPNARRLDVPGTLLAVAGVFSLVYGIIRGPIDGWGDARVLVGIGAGVILLAGLLFWERRAPVPLIDLGLFARPRFAWGTLALGSLLRRFGAPASLALLYLEESGIPSPLPGDVYVAYLGSLATGSILRCIGAWLGIIAAVVAGSSNMFLASRRWGHRLVEHRLAAALHLDRDRLDLAERWMARWGPLAIIFGRHLPGLRIPRWARGPGDPRTPRAAPAGAPSPPGRARSCASLRPGRQWARPPRGGQTAIGSVLARCS